MRKNVWGRYSLNTPKAKFIMIDGSLTSVLPFHLKALGKKPGDYIVAGFDLSPETVDGIKSGYIGIIEDQQPYLQGFLPILQACLTKKYGFAGLYINTGIGLIDSSNVDLIPISLNKESDKNRSSFFIDK